MCSCITCSICGKTENVPGTVKAETTKEVTCTEDGSIKYTATISFNDQTYTTSKIETVQKMVINMMTMAYVQYVDTRNQ